MTDLASLLTDHKMSGRPIRAKYKHFKTICEQTSDNSPTDSSSSCFDDHPSEDLKLCTVAPVLCLPVRSIAQRISEHVIAREVLPSR